MKNQSIKTSLQKGKTIKVDVTNNCSKAPGKPKQTLWSKNWGFKIAIITGFFGVLVAIINGAFDLAIELAIKKNTNSQNNEGKRYFKVQILDEKSSAPVSGVSIQVDPQKIQMFTDANGICEFVFPKNEGAYLTITAFKVGYTEHKVAVCIDSLDFQRLHIKQLDDHDSTSIDL